MGPLRWLLLAAAPVWAQLPTCQVVMWNACDLIFEMQAGEDPAGATLRAEFRSPHRRNDARRAHSGLHRRRGKQS